MNILYHISSNPKITELKIKRPSRWFKYKTKNNLLIEEDNKIERVCFSNSIKGCLSALSPIYKKTLYVYVPREELETYTPTSDQVPDAFLTNEVWGLSDCKVKRIGKIKILDETECMKNTGRGYRIPFSTYKWEWINT